MRGGWRERERDANPQGLHVGSGKSLWRTRVPESSSFASCLAAPRISSPCVCVRRCEATRQTDSRSNGPLVVASRRGGRCSGGRVGGGSIVQQLGQSSRLRLHGHHAATMPSARLLLESGEPQPQQPAVVLLLQQQPTAASFGWSDLQRQW